MNLTLKSTLLSAAALLLATSVMAGEYTRGVVKKVDPKSKKVTIIHEELKNLDMPAMTMVFRTADDAIFEAMKAGSEIEFVADRVKGKLTVIEVK